MYSMTGYGKGIYENNGKKVTVELKTVNHRFLDWGLKFPKTFLFLEDDFKARVKSRIQRGHVDMYLSYDQTESAKGGYKVDVELAKSYIKAAEELSVATGLQNDLTLTALLKTPDVVTRAEDEENEELLREITMNALDEALDNLIIARGKEGEAIKADFILKLDNMQASLDEIKKYAPDVTREYRDKLHARIEEAVAGVVDEVRLATEVALFADKCCIDEEITRLGAHIELARKLINENRPIGRDLDFRIQEMNRETNTISSKANYLGITAEVLKLKNEIEKLREQAQNVE